MKIILEYLSPCDCVGNSLTILPPPQFICVIDLSSYGLVGSCEISDIAEQQELLEASPKTGSEEGPKSSCLSLVADLQWVAHRTRDLSCAAHPRAAFDLL